MPNLVKTIPQNNGNEPYCFQEELDVREEDHRQMYLQMYLKGQQMAMFERQQEVRARGGLRIHRG